MQFGTNFLGHLLLFNLLQPALAKAATPALASRVVSLSSSQHRNSPILFEVAACLLPPDTHHEHLPLTPGCHAGHQLQQGGQLQHLAGLQCAPLVCCVDRKSASSAEQYCMPAGQSQTAKLYLATEIERRFGSQGIHAWAVHPGAGCHMHAAV